MAPRTLAPERTTLDDLMYEILYTLIRLRLLPVLMRQTTIFEGLHAAAKTVRDQENQLNEQVITAEVALGWREESINISVRSLSTAILHIVHNNRTDRRVAPGGYPPGAPTDPDVRISRIRFVRSEFRCGTENGMNGDGWGQRVSRQ